MIRPGAGPAARALAAVALTALALAAVAFRLVGGRWYVVRTPSMGPAAPVGTLLLDRPPGRLRLGELITFHPPGRASVFTHRIVALLPGGGIRTRGDINGAPDGWILTRHDVLGEVVARMWGVGWVVDAIPVLVLGALGVAAITHALSRPPVRARLRVAGAVLVLAVACAVVHPLYGSTVITLSRTGAGAAGTVVSTGLLPTEVHAVGGSSEVIGDGHVAVVRTARVAGDGRFEVTTRPRWPWWALLAVVLAAFGPAGWCLLVGVPERRRRAPTSA